MRKEPSNKVYDVLRWFGLLPIAVLAAWLAWIAVNILGRFSLGSVGVTPDDFIGKLYFMTAGHAAIGIAFVYVGAKIAPVRRVIVAFILGGTGIVVSGFLLFPALMVRDWWAVWGGLFVAVGAGAVVWAVHVGEIDLE
ncbi:MULTISPECIES: hypothetical protein [Methylococcus]|uniref:Lipoprotein n=1 Tax=Methylococcus capsulatus TaxID=414 RepID=A0ABZ2F676_METCP|nr:MULTISPECIES: hypothetical protein [Methylococcus]MDF9392559.1 hypothetical protein [Methylococcus capsulatus]